MKQRLTPPPGQDMLSYFADWAFGAAKTAGNLTQRGVNMAEGMVTTGIDAVGLKDKVENMENMARKLAAKGKSDASKAVNKARRMANRALVFDDDDDGGGVSREYDLLLSSIGAVEKKIAGYMNHTVEIALPSGNGMVWKARVKKHDINFTVKELRNSDGASSIPLVIEPSRRCGPNDLIQGMLEPISRPRTITLIFDNSHSALQRKTVVFWVQVGEKVSLEEDENSAQRTKEYLAAEEGPPDYTTFTLY